MRPPRPIVVGGIDAHRAARDAVVGERDAGGHGVVGERAVAVVAEQLIRLRVVGDEQIDPAVGVVVDSATPSALPPGLATPAFWLDVGELAGAEIAEQLRRARRDRPRACSTTCSCRRARSACRWPRTTSRSWRRTRRGGRRGRSPRTPRWCRSCVDDAGGLRDVGELEAAVVAVQPIALDRRDVEVLVAVVVVVARRDAQPVGRLVEAAALDDVGERAVAVVPVQPVKRRRPAWRPSRGR